MKVGPSNIYLRLLRGQTTPERYVAVLRRAVDMRLRVSAKERAMARNLEVSPRFRRPASVVVNEGDANERNG